MDWTVVIPARVGSVGVKGKNYAEVGGKPLILWAVDAASWASRVVVWTNDPVVRGIVETHRPDVEIMGREGWMDRAETTVDQLVEWWMRPAKGAPTIFLQPTTYPARRLLDFAVTEVEGKEGWWMVSAPSRGLHWRRSGLLDIENVWGKDWVQVEKRENRQTIATQILSETGIRLCVGPLVPYQPIPMNFDRWVDIDTPLDLEVARLLARPFLDILFNLVADEERGYGHLYRCMEVAQELQAYAVRFTGDLDARARQILDQAGWGYDADAEYGSAVDVIVVDRLDTSRRQMADFAGRAGKIVTFENLGDGARMADAVVNDMYWNSASHAGFDWTVLRPEFRGLPPYEVRDEVRKVLVTMGGTDPSRFTEHVMGYLPWTPTEFRIVEPPGRELGRHLDLPGATVIRQPQMALEMREADVVICSAGRTLLEATAVGVPTLVVAQNEREATHGALNRVGWYLGWAHTRPDVGPALSKLCESVELRTQMSRQMAGLIDGKGVQRIARLITDLGSGMA